MNPIDHSILITLSPDGKYLALTTYNRIRKRSHRFLINRSEFERVLCTDELVLFRDLYSFAVIAKHDEKVCFEITWLKNTGDASVQGYVQSFVLPLDKAMSAFWGNTVRHVHQEKTEWQKAKLVFPENTQKYIRKIYEDKMTKRALSKFFRDHFNYGAEEELIITPDPWVSGFCFRSTKSDFAGGIVQHKYDKRGNGGKPYSVSNFTVHT